MTHRLLSLGLFSYRHIKKDEEKHAGGSGSTFPSSSAIVSTIILHLLTSADMTGLLLKRKGLKLKACVSTLAHMVNKCALFYNALASSAL